MRGELIVVDGELLIHAFDSDGSSSSALVASGPTLYGTTYRGGTGQDGTVFSVSTNGTVSTTLHSFKGVDGGSSSLWQIQNLSGFRLGIAFRAMEKGISRHGLHLGPHR